MKQYIDDINSFSAYLKTVSKWSQSDDPFGNIDKSENNYVYEFWCYMKILKALSENPTQIIKFNERTQSFPKSPGSKNEGWSYFEIYDKDDNLLFQICAGTGIKRSDAPTSVHHPDISFQIATASDEPNENDVELIMDAKFQSEKNKKGKVKKLKSIPVGEIHTFSHRVNVLKTKNAHNIKLDFGSLSKLKGNCILSNAEVNKEHGEACEKDFVKQVGRFVPNNVTIDVIGK